MYGSVDSSWNDCINDKNLIIKNNTSYIAVRDQVASAQNTPARATCQHSFTCICDRIDAGELKGCREGGQTRQFSTRVIEGWLKC